jgi:beta propeller domain-containing protein
MRQTKLSQRIITVAMICCIGFIMGCSDRSRGVTPPPPPVGGKFLQLKPFESCGEMGDEVKQILIADMEARLEYQAKRCRYTGDDIMVAMPETEDSGGAESSDTNTQEAGVDEADLIKSDGQFVYAIVDGSVKIARAWPFEDFGQVATITPEGQPQGLYLSPTRLVVISTNNGTVIVEQHDVSTPSIPQLISSQSFIGELVDSRIIDQRLQLAIGNDLLMPQLDYNLDIDREALPECPDEGESTPNGALTAEIERLREANLAVIEAIDVSTLIPQTEGVDSYCMSTYRSRSAAGTSLVTLITDDLSDKYNALQSITVMGNGGAMYVSTEGVYLASPFNASAWSMPEDENTDATVVHRFSLESGLPACAGSALVDGHLLDNGYAGSRHSQRFSMAQFAMSEFEGSFRIATTKNGMSDGLGSESFVTILDVNASLVQTGQVGEMGRGERIHAVRFMGDKGYVVTFKRVDPLYVLDLSNPAAPAVVGELKIPGFSTYLHPVGDTHLIGLGFGTDDQGSFAWTQSVKLSLFDVSDPSNPIEVGNRLIGTRGSYSTAVEEHHAFTFDPVRKLLALPIDRYEGSQGGGDVGEPAGAGVMLMKVDLAGTFDDVGEIAFPIEEGSQNGSWGSSGIDVLRTILIGDGQDDGIITLTSEGVQLNRIDEEMTEVGSI